MELIEQNEMNDFHAILRNHHIDIADFSLSEIDTTDPKSDEIFPLQGFLTVTRTSNGMRKQYVIGDGTPSWVELFQKDLDGGAFN